MKANALMKRSADRLPQLGDKKSGFGDQSEAASHKTGCSPEGEKSGSTEVLRKKGSEAADFVERGSKNMPGTGSNP